MKLAIGMNKLFSALFTLAINDVLRYFISKKSEYLYYFAQTKNKKSRYTHVYPSFTIKKWGLKGLTFHGHVILMHVQKLL